MLAEDAETIASATAMLLDDGERRRELAARARAFAAEHYSAEAYGRRLEAVYEEVASRPEAPMTSGYGALMSAQDILVSVVIPTHQRRELLRRALAALGRQDLPADSFEVIVSIDGSTDGTSEMIETYTAPYTLRSVQGPRRGRGGGVQRRDRARER